MSETSLLSNVDLVCFSHLRWNFVYQRPQHLLSRAANQRRTFFVEEPLVCTGAARLDVRREEHGLYVVVPHLPEGMTEQSKIAHLKFLLDSLLVDFGIARYLTWYYTPMALKFSRHLRPLAVIYDCMDQLSGFLGAPKELGLLERELFKRVDVVFTGGRSLYEDKRSLHGNVHAFPSSVDVAHFAKARFSRWEPDDLAKIPRPRLGYAGVIDERFDVSLVEAVAAARPTWQLVLIGPVVKISPKSLPRRDNIHYLGAKTYDELPSYLGGWDMGLLPFALNEATRFISPTKTPEYLAAGLRVVSTPIRDVVRPYGELGLAAIAHGSKDFVARIEEALHDADCRAAWIERADTFLASMSWDETFAAMWSKVEAVLQARHGASQALWPTSVRDRASQRAVTNRG